MADVAKRLVGPSFLGSTATSVYNVPTGVQTIVRSIHVNSTSASAAYTFTLGIGGTTAANQYFTAMPVPSNGCFDWSGFLVLNANDTIYVQSNGSSVLTITVCGIEVS